MNLSRHAGRNNWTGLIVAALLILAANKCDAAFKTVIGGISIAYSGDGATAYYDETDGTLTIEITESGGTLKVTAGPDAVANWGDYADVYVLADDVTFKSMQFKGSSACRLYLTGQVFYVSKFSLTYGVVGDTVYYGDQGLGMVSSTYPVSISIKYGWTTGPLLGIYY